MTTKYDPIYNETGDIFLDIDRAIELLQRAKESGAEYITVQFNRDGKGFEGLRYVGSWHDSTRDGGYILCFEHIDDDEWISGYDDDGWKQLRNESERAAADALARAARRGNDPA